MVGRLYIEEFDPGTITGLEPAALPEFACGVTRGREAVEEAPSDDLFNVPPLVPYKVGR